MPERRIKPEQPKSPQPERPNRTDLDVNGVKVTAVQIFHRVPRITPLETIDQAPGGGQ